MYHIVDPQVATVRGAGGQRKCTSRGAAVPAYVHCIPSVCICVHVECRAPLVPTKCPAVKMLLCRIFLVSASVNGVGYFPVD